MAPRDYVTIGELNIFRDDLEAKRKEDMDNIMKILKPMAESYSAASKIGKWVMAALLFVSILLGIIIATIKLTKL